MAGTVQIAVPREFQGTLKFILEEAARQYSKAAADQESSESTREAWRVNAARCLEIAAQLRRT